MGHALVVALTNWKDERMKEITIDEINMLKGERKEKNNTFD